MEIPAAAGFSGRLQPQRRGQAEGEVVERLDAGGGLGGLVAGRDDSGGVSAHGVGGVDGGGCGHLGRVTQVIGILDLKKSFYEFLRTDGITYS